IGNAAIKGPIHGLAVSKANTEEPPGKWRERIIFHRSQKGVAFVQTNHGVAERASHGVVVNLAEQRSKDSGIVLVDSDETHVEERHVLPGLWKGGRPKQCFDGVGCRHHPPQAFSVGDHPSLLEGALIPAAYHPNYMVVSKGNEKI